MDLETLLDLERRGWRSLCEGSGAEFYGELMTPSGLMVLAHGQVLDRDAVIASLAEAPTWDDVELDDARRVEVGDDGAALVYRARATRADLVFEAHMSSVYVVHDGRARLALYQQTPVPD